MKKTCLAFLLAAISAAAIAEDSKTSALLSKFSLDRDIGWSKTGTTVYLIKDGSKWSWSRDADINKDGVDQIAIEFETRTIKLVAAESPDERNARQGQAKFGGDRLAASPYNGYEPGRDIDGRWNCVYSTMPKSMDNANREVFGYNVCASSFVKEAPKKGDPGAGNLWRSRKFVVLDKDKLFAAIESSGLVGELETMALEAYRSSFSAARNSESLNIFATHYKNLAYDPEGLIAKAESLALEKKAEEDKAAAAKLAAREAEEKRRAAEKAEKERKLAVERAAEEQRIAAEQATENKRHAKELAAEKTAAEKWRKTVAVESETNCGPVLEVKGKLVKVYSPIQGYGNEHWLRKDDLFPPGSGCRFVNGQYAGRG